MPLFLTIREGETASSSRPILVTTDQKVIEMVGQHLARRLGRSGFPDNVSIFAKGKDKQPLSEQTDEAS
jgi:hypothetical protein